MWAQVWYATLIFLKKNYPDLFTIFVHLSEKKIDLKTVNIAKLKVKELKKILHGWGEECEGCVEKSDYVSRVEALKLKHTEL